MGWFSDILREYPAFLNETERLAALDAENQKRKKGNAKRQSGRGAEQKPQQFMEFEGALWRERDGRIDTTIYCTCCKKVMVVIGRGTNESVVCSECNYVAPFQPAEIEKLARLLESKAPKR